MPIRPEMKDKYPPNWKEISDSIRERENHQCKFCGLPNYATGWRDPQGKFWPGSLIFHLINRDCHSEEYTELMTWFDEARHKPITIVLTVAHLDQDPTNNNPENLAALCQQCHNRHDMPHRIRNRQKRKRHLEGQLTLGDPNEPQD